VGCRPTDGLGTGSGEGFRVPFGRVTGVSVSCGREVVTLERMDVCFQFETCVRGKALSMLLNSTETFDLGSS